MAVHISENSGHLELWILDRGRRSQVSGLMAALKKNLPFFFFFAISKCFLISTYSKY